MKVIIAPDSFKGTLTAAEVCAIIAQAFREVCPAGALHCLPLADGGEGMAAAWHAVCGGELRQSIVSGPYGEPLQAEWLLLPDGTAVLETASCAGLELARPLNPENTTTAGVGQLMLRAQEAGASRILLGLGGSATNDAGAGLACSLGWRFLDDTGKAFCPKGGTLQRIAQAIPPSNPFALPVTAACDVQAPLYGPQGAAAVYAPQKGADSAMVQRLDAGLRHISAIMEAEAAARVPGAGAAGGLGFGILACCGGELRSGIALLLEQAGFDAMLAGADLVVTGEGRMDGQTLQGKGPMGVLRQAQRQGVPVIGICGCLGEGAQALLEAGFAALYPAEEASLPMEQLRITCRETLFRSAKRAFLCFCSKEESDIA